MEAPSVNFNGIVSIDNEFDPTSENPQSGIAVAEAVAGAGGDVYEHIESITTTANTNRVDFNVEPSGDAYNFKKMHIIITCPSGGSGNAYFHLASDTSAWCAIYFLLTNTTSIAEFKIENGLLFAETHSGCGSYSQHHNYSTPLPLTTINKITIIGNGTILAGTKFDIYAVR